MRAIVSAAALAVALTGAAVAQSTTSPSTGSAAPSATKMTQADCTARWTRLDSTKSGSLSKTQVQSVVTDFDAADTNKDGNLSQSEFMSACQKGLVTASSATGAGSRGLSGSDSGMNSPGTS